MKKYLILALAFVSTAVFTACDKDDPEVEDPQELITTVNYTLTSTDGETVVFTFQDLDGDGGAEATITGGTLTADRTYTGSLELLDESDTNDVEDITEEIAEEDEEHQFFFSSTVAGLEVAYADADEMGNPVGLANTLTTGSAGSGVLTVILRHEPVKDAEGVSAGDITNAQGETDIEVSFPVTVQ